MRAGRRRPQGSHGSGWIVATIYWTNSVPAGYSSGMLLDDLWQFSRDVLSRWPAWAGTVFLVVNVAEHWDVFPARFRRIRDFVRRRFGLIAAILLLLSAFQAWRLKPTSEISEAWPEALLGEWECISANCTDQCSSRGDSKANPKIAIAEPGRVELTNECKGRTTAQFNVARHSIQSAANPDPKAQWGENLGDVRPCEKLIFWGGGTIWKK